MARYTLLMLKDCLLAAALTQSNRQAFIWKQKGSALITIDFSVWCVLCICMCVCVCLLFVNACVCVCVCVCVLPVGYVSVLESVSVCANVY